MRISYIHLCVCSSLCLVPWCVVGSARTSEAVPGPRSVAPGATSGAATDQLAAPAPGKKRKRVDFNPAERSSTPTAKLSEEPPAWTLETVKIAMHNLVLDQREKKQGR
ncbi:hypothetical protein EMIHUDRAFT_254337 [Emiliania huxleyi CCMP1516]|uniref:Uncharacterized protein n=2 Tax=Emiliania huxleyi TaxID=2903 RepID=A0A0D3JUZ0_EMIH1|nr:hypothetical protein EMIHUDRAFT_254337 [Emiliania huxleyi CCMP1516]EOD27325.1 hypothetical protein EMIHUDRAFT_254337 [Emiliania huxleyi CCMP1516]|eukprot:XP_005779754.1 hypothetical protein EMIHUDRAFT_254337 [Emiliania huxleyi CCMP1516]